MELGATDRHRHAERPRMRGTALRRHGVVRSLLILRLDIFLQRRFGIQRFTRACVRQMVSLNEGSGCIQAGRYVERTHNGFERGG